MKNQLKLILKK